MVLHERRRDNIMTQVCLALLTVAIGLFGWAGDKWVSSLEKRFDDIETVQREFFKKTECLEVHVARCCKDDLMCS